MTAVLEVTDGTTTVNLLDPQGIHLNAWRPGVLQFKGGGVWRNSPLANGRQLALTRTANIIDTYNCKIRGTSQDDAIFIQQELVRLLMKGVEYWTTEWQDTPVWIVAKATDETNTRYAQVKSFSVPELENPFAQPFLQPKCVALMDEINIIIEHTPWQDQTPGNGSCAQTSAELADWEYEGTWAIISAAPTALVWEIIETPTGRMLACADDGNVWRSDDGVAWVAAALPDGDLTRSMTVGLSNFIFAIGRDGFSDPSVWRSADDGVSWTKVESFPEAAGDPSASNRIILGSDGLLYAVIDLELQSSADNGVTWTVIGPGGTESNIFQAADGYFYLGSTSTSFSIRRTLTPAVAASWVTVAVGYSVWGVFELNGILFAGASGNILQSADGSAWSVASTDPTDDVLDIILADTGFFYAVDSDITGNTGLVLKSADGINWDTDFTAADSLQALLQFSTDRRIYGSEDGDIIASSQLVTVGRAATCLNEVYFGNQQMEWNLTHVKVDDGGVFSDEFPMTVTYALLPAVPVNNDQVYFGIDSANYTAGAPPFSSIVFDIDTIISITTGQTFVTVWEYWNGAWVTLTVTDNTDTNGHVFDTVGVNSVHWIPPSDWATTAIDGITALWVRMRIHTISGGVVTPPTQQNRDPYTIGWARVDIDDAQVGGDIAALARFLAFNEGDLDGTTVSEPDLWVNRVIVGLRSMSRGDEFRAYLNITDEQTSPGITVFDQGANTAFQTQVRSIVGRTALYTKPAAAGSFASEIRIDIGAIVATHYYGTYHAFLRVNGTGTELADVDLRLRFNTPLGGAQFTSDILQVDDTQRYHLLDFGQVQLPATSLLQSSELPDTTGLNIQIRSNSATAGSTTIEFFDLILIPVDEWYGDFFDQLNNADSPVEFNTFLDVDSIKFPKRDLRALVRTVGAETLSSVYAPFTVLPAFLQQNADQRLWWLAGGYTAAGGSTWRWRPTVAWSFRAEKLQRYMGMRGAR